MNLKGIYKYICIYMVAMVFIGLCIFTIYVAHKGSTDENLSLDINEVGRQINNSVFYEDIQSGIVDIERYEDNGYEEFVVYSSNGYMWDIVLKDEILQYHSRIRSDRCYSFEAVNSFLKNDTTDQHPYIWPAYMCGDFSETLIQNASHEQIMLGAVLTSPNKYFLSFENHILCYFICNIGEIYFVEPQTDSIMTKKMFDNKYKYYVVLPKGVMPTAFNNLKAIYL